MSCVVFESINAEFLVLHNIFVSKRSLFLPENSAFNSFACFCKSPICCWSMASCVRSHYVSVSIAFVKSSGIILFAIRLAIWYPFVQSKNVKNTHGGVPLLVKLQAFSQQIKVTFFHGCFSRFLNCKNGDKSCKTSHLAKTSLKSMC